MAISRWIVLQPIVTRKDGRLWGSSSAKECGRLRKRRHSTRFTARGVGPFHPRHDSFDPPDEPPAMPPRPLMGSPTISDTSASSAESGDGVEPGALTLLLADVHLRSGHHSHLYRETEHGTRSLYFIKHGSGSFSRKLYKGQPTAPGTPNVRESEAPAIPIGGSSLTSMVLSAGGNHRGYAVLSGEAVGDEDAVPTSSGPRRPVFNVRNLESF